MRSQRALERRAICAELTLVVIRIDDCFLLARATALLGRSNSLFLSVAVEVTKTALGRNLKTSCLRQRGLYARRETHSIHTGGFEDEECISELGAVLPSTSMPSGSLPAALERAPLEAVDAVRFIATGVLTVSDDDDDDVGGLGFALEDDGAAGRDEDAPAAGLPKKDNNDC